jgi:two-component system, cell cycle response regulator
MLWHDRDTFTPREFREVVFECSLREETSVSDHVKVVVADDSALYRRLIRDTLEDKGHDVRIATNGHEAVELVSDCRPAVLITDWEMPDMNGIELSKMIRKDTQSFVYIILLTGNSDKEQVVEGLQSGADDYLTKPFHPGELVARVAVGIRMAELTREIQQKNKLLEELSLTDPLTGLPNRRAFEQWATRELSGAVRHQFGFWLVMADLDKFKSINDVYGHAAGDEVLRRFSAVLRQNTRASNICARLGGEEFVLVLSHIDKPGVGMALERLRHMLAQEHFGFAPSLSVTASFGVAGLTDAGSTELAGLLSQADAALYLAKQQGRNRFEFAENASTARCDTAVPQG